MKTVSLWSPPVYDIFDDNKLVVIFKPKKENVKVRKNFTGGKEGKYLHPNGNAFFTTPEAAINSTKQQAARNVKGAKQVMAGSKEHEAGKRRRQAAQAAYELKRVNKRIAELLERKANLEKRLKHLPKDRHGAQ